MSRIPKERMEKALEQLKTISEEDYAKVKALAAIVKPLRSVLHKTPDDYGMTGWRDIISLRMTTFLWKAGTSPPREEKVTNWLSSITLCRCVAQVSRDT